MALINFSNPDYKFKTVYAVACSHTETALKIAKANQIPIDYSCENGECGNCAIRVSSIDMQKPRLGYHLTEKEKSILLQAGKLSKEEMEQLALDDLPSKWRLACQFIPRDEDVLIEY